MEFDYEAWKRKEKRLMRVLHIIYGLLGVGYIWLGYVAYHLMVAVHNLEESVHRR